MLSVILTSPDLERLYTGLSLLVSSAAAGEDARALVTFGPLGDLLADDLEARALDPARTPSLSPAGRPLFARTLAEMRRTAEELDNVMLYACSAAVECVLESSGPVLDGTMSTPRFLAGAGRLVVV